MNVNGLSFLPSLISQWVSDSVDLVGCAVDLLINCRRRRPLPFLAPLVLSRLQRRSVWRSAAQRRTFWRIIGFHGFAREILIIPIPLPILPLPAAFGPLRFLGAPVRFVAGVADLLLIKIGIIIIIIRTRLLVDVLGGLLEYSLAVYIILGGILTALDIPIVKYLRNVCVRTLWLRRPEVCDLWSFHPAFQILIFFANRYRIIIVGVFVERVLIIQQLIMIKLNLFI